MEEYIPKSVVLAEIEKIRAKWFGINNDFANGQKGALTDILSIINTFEVKEVDLEKELDSMITPELKFHKALPSLFDVAKHFFELGMVVGKEQKGE